jgi:hypothetical protein
MSDSIKIKKEKRKTISIPVGDYGTSNFGTFDSDLIQKLDHRHSFTEKQSKSVGEDIEQIIEDDPKSKDVLEQILHSKDISRRPLENKKQMSLWELRYRKNLAKSGHTGTLTVPKDLKAKYNSKSLRLDRDNKQIHQIQNICVSYSESFRRYHFLTHTSLLLALLDFTRPPFNFCFIFFF